MSHFIKKCTCGITLETCRCPSKDKTVIIEKKPGRVDYYSENDLIPEPLRVNFINRDKAWELMKKQDKL